MCACVFAYEKKKTSNRGNRDRRGVQKSIYMDNHTNNNKIVPVFDSLFAEIASHPLPETFDNRVSRYKKVKSIYMDHTNNNKIVRRPPRCGRRVLLIFGS